MNPLKAFDKLNDIQKEEDPRLYEPTVVNLLNAAAQRQRQEDCERERHQSDVQQRQQRKFMAAQEFDKALFDFDEDINRLEQVQERYPA